jgi:alkylation response protein AidB-like acyl-CoA dehydrogenase
MATTNEVLRGGEFLLRDTDAVEVFTPEDFTPEDLLIARTASDFLRKEVMPHVDKIESGDHDLMNALIRKAGQIGLLGADVPEAYGGLDAKQTTAALIAEKLNPQQSFALTHEAHTVIATLPILHFGNHDQKSRYLPKLATGEWIGSFALSEAGSGSDALALQTRGVLAKEGKTYTVNGVKMWITNAAFADLFTVFGKVDDKVTVFLIERTFPGVSFGKEEHKLGMHGTSTRRVILEDVHVPVENVLEVGKGHYAAFCALNMGRFKLEAGAVGGLKYLIELCAGYAQQRKTFGRPIGEWGLVKHKLAEMAARTFGLESMVYRLAGDLERIFAPIDPTAADASERYHRAAEEFAIECSIVKVIGSESYSELADEAIQIHGGNGYTEEFPLARAWRDQRLLRIGEGANEIVRGVIVNTLLRRDKAGRLPILDVGRELAALEVELDSGIGRFDDSRTDIQRIANSAQQAKNLALACLAESHDRLDGPAGLAEAQEIAAAIADIVCGAYGLDSIALRLAKMPGGERTNAAVILGKVAAIGYDAMVDAGVRAVIENLPNSTFGAIVSPIQFNESPMALRRAAADLVMGRGGLATLGG